VIPRLHPLIALPVCAVLLAGQAPADDATIRPLPQLTRSIQWQTEGSSPLRVATVGDTLAVTIDPTPGVVADLLLAEPITIAEGDDNLNFHLSTSAQPSQFDCDALFQDAGGRTWAARTKLPGADAYHGSLGMINTGQLKGRNTRLSVPVLGQPDNDAFYRVKTSPPPPRPWKWIGLRFTGDAQPHHTKAPVILYLNRFALSARAMTHSAYAGIAEDAEFCREIDGSPGVPVSAFAQSPGIYAVEWTLFPDYAGVPKARGYQTATIRSTPDALPLPLQLGAKIPLPQQPPGTYWIRWRAKCYPGTGGEGAPARILQGEDRLYVKSAAGSPASAASSDESLPPGWLRISPRGPSYVSDAAADFGLKIQAARPTSITAAGELRFTVVTSNLRTPVKTGTLPLDFSHGDTAEAALDFSNLPPGPYRVEVTYLVDGKTFDRQSILTGLTAPLQSSSPLAQLPPGVLNWKQAFARKEPYFHLSPMWHSATRAMTDRNRWFWFKNALEQAAPVSRDIEYTTPWSVLEPLPGVYDWEEMCLVLRKAQELGEKVLLWPGFWGEEPEWLPTVPCETSDGRIFYDFAYNLHNVRQDYGHSPELQKALTDALSHYVDETKENPAVQGYFLIQELPGDAPFVNWMVGYSKPAREQYRRWLETKFQTPEALSARWGRPVKSFAEIDPPVPAASPRERLDWLVFRGSTQDRFMRTLIDCVRAQDPLRPLFIYGDLFGLQLGTDELVALGCAKANGGSHDAMHPFPISEGGLGGILQRTEDHFPGKWTAYFPEVLDDSVFAMSYGGGQAMNCKAYMFTYLPEFGKDRLIRLDDVRKPPFSFDKYERFMPIWTALRQTDRLPVEVIELLDTEAGLLANGWLNRNGLWDGEAQLALYRSQVNFGAAEFPTAGRAKLLLMIKDHLDTLTEERIGQIRDYVANGGHLLLTAAAGRHSVEQPEGDWALLKALDFPPPSSPEIRKGNVAATPAPGQDFDSALGAFPVRGAWWHQPAADEHVVAVDPRNPSMPMLTWKPLGKGGVAVVWGEKLIPRNPIDGTGNVLRAAAHWAGVADVTSATTPYFWMNILHDSRSGRYFGLAMAGQWQGRPDGPSAGNASFGVDPQTTYRVKELITGREEGTLSGRDIATKGLPLRLQPREVAIFQFDPTPPTAAGTNSPSLSP